MQDVVGKMAVLDYLPEINLLHLSKHLEYMHIKELDIISINLSTKIDQETFLISDSPKVRYFEVGILSFIEDVGTVPIDLFFNKSISNLYILRDGTYKDMKYILRQVGKHGMNLGRGRSQRAHVISPLDLRLSAYLMAMSSIMYPEIVTQNMFFCLPKDMYLPYYDKKKLRKITERYLNSNYFTILIIYVL